MPARWVWATWFASLKREPLTKASVDNYFKEVCVKGRHPDESGR
jgi:hypothetical protein